MNIQPVSFCGNISKGKKEFEKLSDYKKIILKATEKIRQQYNQTHVPPILTKDTDLAEYVKHVSFIENFMENRINDILAKFKKSLYK